ncbi:hypothetical protein Ato02nite_027730 [Paractinoplanes toevensis]|uniref:Uncharacterized protein n=1 Tax=Paractinoplanes toevensis TaxID=571911 RepID=A0A919W3X5_9ACTN|nr:hypothetical protein Ato02nite_027730 [Actinoplanes toevensis]
MAYLQKPPAQMDIGLDEIDAGREGGPETGDAVTGPMGHREHPSTVRVSFSDTDGVSAGPLGTRTAWPGI